MATLIKRYANRKLYNTETSRYITLKGIAKLLDDGEEVRVVDKETGEDITQVALSQILVDNQRSREDPSDTLLTQILSRGGDALYGAIKKSVDEATDGLGDFQSRFRSFVSQAEAEAGGVRGFRWDARGDGERRSPFLTNQPGERPDESDFEDEPDKPEGAEARDADASSGTGSESGRSGWPRLGGLPDFREAIRNGVANALEAQDWPNMRELPTKRDLDTLNQNLSRVAEAIERLEISLRNVPVQRVDPDEDPDGN